MQGPVQGASCFVSRRQRIRSAVCVLFLLRLCNPIAAQDQQPQYPRFLADSYIGVQLGYIDYPFSNAQLEPGFHAQSIQVPHLGARVFLFGHEFGKYFSAQISDLRPVYWVHYQDVNGDQASHSVWMNVAGVTARARLPLTRALSVFGEGGFGLVTRRGFSIGQTSVVTSTDYGTFLMGAGMQYSLTPEWSLVSAITAAPGNSESNQPRTLFFSGGFTYTLRQHPQVQTADNSMAASAPPKNILRMGYVTDAFGFGINDFVSKGAVPIFWPGVVYVARGWSADYQRNLFHTRRFFSLDWGGTVSAWKSRENSDSFYTAAVYPVFHFIPVRTGSFSFNLGYSLAGPAFISATAVDGQLIGRHFTFQDFISSGVLIGRRHKISAEVRIAHYSNGNLFPQNPGVTVPLGFYLGTAF